MKYELTKEQLRSLTDPKVKEWFPEVFEALKNEAIKRGYKDGVFMEGLYFGTKEAYKCTGNDFDYEEIPLQVLKGKMGLRDKVGNVIFCDGVWAEIIQTKTKAEAEKELNCKIVD